MKKSKIVIKVDPALDEKFKGKVLFPEKLKEANETIKKYGLPPKNL